MDLILCQKESENLLINYQFWIKNIKDNRFISLFEVYYKTAEIFIFVYNIANKETFIKLEETIKEIKNVKADKQFIGLLVGFKSDLS